MNDNETPMMGGHNAISRARSDSSMPIVPDNPYDNQVGGDHYQKAFPKIQPTEFFCGNDIPFTEANVCKYVLRHAYKNGIEDLRKARHYLEILAFEKYGEEL